MRATPDGMKVCSKCRKNREVVWFSKDKITVDGLRPQCQECTRSQRRERYLRLKETYWKTIVMTGTKKCSKCGETKDVSVFSPQARGKDGRSHHCNVCRNALCMASKRKRFEKDPEFFLTNRREIKNMCYRRGGWVAQAEYKVNRQRENR